MLELVGLLGESPQLAYEMFQDILLDPNLFNRITSLLDLINIIYYKLTEDKSALDTTNLRSILKPS
jgi:hypothetical protein